MTKQFVLKYRNPTDLFQSSKVCFRGNCSNSWVTVTRGLHNRDEQFQKLFTTYATLTLLLSHNTEQKFQLQIMSKS